MRRQLVAVLTVAAVALAAVTTPGAAPRASQAPKKKVLVELFTSQG